LEFFVTHKSSLEKLHSGNKIIEIPIESEKDIYELSEKGIKESDNSSSYMMKDLSLIRFYGFKNVDYDNCSISNEIEFIRYILYMSGKSQCFKDYCDCRKLYRTKPYSLLEICIHSFGYESIYEKVKYIGFRKFGIPNCILCRNYVDRYNDMGSKICRLYKHLQIPLDEINDTGRAKKCCCFTVDIEEMKSVLEKGLGAEYTVL